MKQLFFLSFLVLSLISCKNDQNSSNDEEVVIKKIEKEPLADGEEIFRGEFIYYEDTAVLNTSRELYAVKVDEKMMELVDVAKAIKKSEYDMANVVIHGKLGPNPRHLETGDAWEQMITITKIIEVSPAKSANVITTGKTLDIKEVK
ncbi:component of SufBCD complex [Nonlabens dokdonensis]|jgi:hypothetical protein|uniref:Component of SufBCD complex n=1 Tax=Nonlabens dokdonensis TaxID=328515 RepID=A0A1Z8AZX8_9FLAO|nr:component of SufBCD complex [Nonlabens dokdonensis]OUS15881.1 component of SufBCD complex [Nonlabens dokdonensis]